VNRRDQWIASPIPVAEATVSLFQIDQLFPRAVEIALGSGVIVYDVLFLALAEDADMVVVSDDDGLLKRQRGHDAAVIVAQLGEQGAFGKLVGDLPVRRRASIASIAPASSQIVSDVA
jgi:hypothetical protein